jgi:hypothetical protein
LQLEARANPWPRRLGAVCAGSLVALAIGLSAAPIWSALSGVIVLAAIWHRRGTAGADQLSFSGRRFEQVGSALAGELRDHASLGPLLSLQLLLDDGRRRAVIYGPWNLSAEQRRRLRLHLRRLEAAN